MEKLNLGQIEFDEKNYGTVITNSITFNIEHYVNKIFNQVTIDPTYNRDGGWDEVREIQFIEKLIKMGRFIGEIHLCDIEECIKNSTDNETKQYFQNFKSSGFKYVCIDGNNRGTTLSKYLTIVDEDYVDRLKNINLTVKMYYKIHKNIISQEFLMINNGLQQSKQTTTNATYPSEFSKWIQKLSKKSTFLKYFLSKNDFNKKLNQQLIVRIFMIIDSHVNGKKTPSMEPEQIDSVYKMYQNTLPSNESLNLTEDIIEYLSDMLSTNKVKYRGQNFIINTTYLLIKKFLGKKINLSRFWETYLEAHTILNKSEFVTINNQTFNPTNDYKDKWSRKQFGGFIEKRCESLYQIISQSQDEFVFELELV
jgi:hypothetical protein